MSRKLLALILSLIVLMSLCSLSVSAEKDVLKFGKDGKFRIMQINDFQDRDNTNSMSLDFLEAALDIYKPDLVVLVGDQLHNSFPGITEEKIKTTIRNQLMPIEERGIPFLFTFGNHDRDHQHVMSMEDQAAFYRSFSSCYANTYGADGGTYNTVIYGKDGATPVLNIYMMDTQHWNGKGDTSGVTESQVQWYKETSNSLKAQNEGKPLPSLVFQHIPVKEIFKLIKVVPADTPGAVKDVHSNNYLILDENAEWIGDRNIMREGPASENPDKITGQYEAWLEQGDIIGAYFGHEHINTFVGKTEDGIVLGYNGGFGFATYGDEGERYARIYDFNESNVADYSQQTIYYTECMAYEPPATEAPEEPTEPEEPENPSDNCSCNCHRTGLMGIIWKILNFFYKLFGMNKTCECGITHY